jgi:exodeoxyribonuclease VII large subunit
VNENRQYITITELNSRLSSLISQDKILNDIPVVGEISDIKIVRGHMYSTIKDENSSIPFIVFNIKTYQYIPNEGDKILTIGSPNLYEKTGKISFIAQYVEPFGIGKLYIEFEQLKKKLSKNGYFKEIYKKPLPKYPIQICVVTSKQGAVINDIVTTIRRKNHLINIDLIDVAVQGENAVKEIVNGLKLADEQGYDVIILARGGGSFEDLMPFNAEIVAETIFNMKTCLVSAIGHETDFTIADFVADKRASTPTAAAEIIAFSVLDLITEINDILSNIETKINLKILKAQQKIFSRGKDIQYHADKKINNCFNLVNNYIGKINILNPNNILQKGYFKIKKGQQEVFSVKDFSVGDELKITGYDSEITAEVIQVKKRK